MLYRIMFSFVFSASVIADGAPAKTVKVIELFTSQGCYSCPPADKFLGELSQREEIITFSCHVTYWNYLGWKDTFSRPFCDRRQRQYQDVLVGGSKGVYTPQMVINGRYVGVGSQRSKIERLLTIDARQQAPVQRLVLRMDSRQLRVELPELSNGGAQKLQLFLLGTSGEHLLPIKTGENSGKHLPYFNPIEYTQHLGRWSGDAKTLNLPLVESQVVKDWLIVAQEWPLGAIVAAGKLSLSSRANVLK
ncbi:MAG: hypothetical protein ACI9D5_000722 [Candidatus Endobugula sp.]|jgi:hypothetical protein